ncbi:MAG: enoyl-CoA hydratase-related protein [Planctomycetota bacterium]
MSYHNLLFVVADGVATVTIDRPKALNALNSDTLGEMEEVFEICRADEGVRAVLVTGAGEKSFVAGADINELATMQPLSAKAIADRGQRCLARLEEMGKPTVAMINGFALGGGLELALACHLRTASTTARLGLPEVSLGIIPGYGGTQRLARIAGPGVAREWILTGEMFSAEDAHRVGVVNRVFPPAELLEGTMKLIHTILSRGPLALRFALEAIGRGANMPQRQGEMLESDLFGLAASTQDMREGMQAFLGKRKPSFQGK